MKIKSRIIPARPRNKELLYRSTGGVGIYSSGRGGSSSEGDINSHTHHNKSILDSITLEMLENALREMLGVDNTEEATDENFFSALRTLKEIIDNNEVLKGLFLSKITDDTAQGFIEFLKGISVKELATFLGGLTSEGLAKFNAGLTSEELATFLKGISVKELATLTQGLEVGEYTPGFLGSGASLKMNNGISELEVDKLTVRMIATFFEIVVSKLRHINGGLVLSRGAMTCSRVIEDTDSYQCFFERGENNEISNTFVVNDQARCQVFNAGNQKFYWRLVTEVGDDWIRLSKTVGIGDSIPAAGDDIVQLGYQGKDLAHVKRLNAQIIDESGISQYVEIDSFTLEGKRRNFISADGTGSQFTGKVTFKNGGEDYDLSDWAHETETAIQDAETTIQEAVDKIAPPVWVVQAVNIIPNAPTAIFRRGKDEELHQLTLVPKFTRDGIDVTDIMNQSGLRLYEFERNNMWGEDDKGVLDSAWNLANKGRTQITLTHEDIVFIGNINMVFHSELLEQEYQLLK